MYCVECAEFNLCGDFMDLRDRLRMLRERTGMDQTEFCSVVEKSGFFITLRQYRKIESGKAKVSLNELAAIVRTLGVSADALLLCDDSKLPPQIIGRKERRLVERRLGGSSVD
jgi:transcriptional regulator with XRE-family HTH domain